MNPPKVTDQDYINFLIATPKVCSATEAARVQPEGTAVPAHDAFTRLLHRLEPDAATLWQEAAGQVERHGGILVLDDSTLDKPYAEKMALVHRHGSGKHHAVVEGINLITLLWTEGDRPIPVDSRLYDKAGDALTKNDHFHAVLKTASERDFHPACVVFDSGYGSLENLKQIRTLGWVWLTRLKANRLVNPDRSGLRPVARVDTHAHGTVVHLKGYGLIRLFSIVAPDSDREWWASNDLNMTSLTRIRFAGYAWTIEHDHRGIKQYCGVERAQVRAARAQRNHIGLALRAFLRLEGYCYRAGVSWFEAKTAIIRPAVRAYLANPLYTLPATA
ncbi:MAG TPA: transposase [Candidatus Competibacteraceae bacterium]|nr:transposase [Candidatus Competibacteraceae bacterium]